MHGTVSCWPCTNRSYVSIGVHLNLKLLFVFDTDTVSGRTLILPLLVYCQNKLKCNGDNGSASVFVECMERCRVDPARTVVCLYWCVLEFEVVVLVQCSMRPQSREL